MSRLTVEAVRAVHEQRPSGRPRTPEQPQPAGGASEKSVKFLRTLVEERYPKATEEYVQSVIDQGQSRVSRAIEKLLTMPKVKLNTYTGMCQNCRKRVGVKEGFIKRNEEGRWETFHFDGECQTLDLPFPEGRYAIRGEEDVKFYVINESGIYAQASDDLHRITSRKAQAEIIKTIAEDPKTAAILYGVELGVCGRCGKTLTSEWRKEGIGPVCVEKAGWSV